MPENSVGSVPQIAGLSPELTAIATRPPNAMYAPARKPPTSALSQLSSALVVPVSTAAAAVS